MVASISKRGMLQDRGWDDVARVPHNDEVVMGQLKEEKDCGEGHLAVRGQHAGYSHQSISSRSGNSEPIGNEGCLCNTAKGRAKGRSCNKTCLA